MPGGAETGCATVAVASGRYAILTTILGYAMLAIGAAGILASALGWRANLPEIKMLGILAALAGYAILPAAADGTGAKITTTALLVIAGTSSIQKMLYFGGGTLLVGAAIVLVTAAGMWFVWG